MSLKLALKPNERMIIGGAVIRNGDKPADLMVESNVSVLREKDIVSEEKANSPCRRIYYVIQLMYLDERNLREYHAIYWGLVRELLNAAPSMLVLIDRISEQILENRYYHALKTARKLIHYEEELLGYGHESLSGL